jgi:hypothetical protein
VVRYWCNSLPPPPPQYVQKVLVLFNEIVSRKVLLIYWRCNPVCVWASSMVPHRLWRFCNRFVLGGVVAPRLTPSLEESDYTPSSTYPLTCLARLALPEVCAPASMVVRVTGALRPYLHDKAAVLQERGDFSLENKPRTTVKCEESDLC